jgi:predicted Rdx family selenoprotein
MLSTSLSFGQEQIILRGTVRDSITKEVLSDVRISVNQDMVGVRNSASGEFQITVNRGDKVWFRKQGYGWKNIVVTGNNVAVIELAKNPPGLSELHINNPDVVPEYYVNGVLIPKEEWNDIRLNKDDIARMNLAPVVGGVRRFDFTTK